MNKRNPNELLNEILEWANSDETKTQSVNDLAHYLFTIKEIKETRAKQNEAERDWENWKKDKISIILWQKTTTE